MVDVARPYGQRRGDRSVSDTTPERFSGHGLHIRPLAYLTDFKTIGGCRGREARGVEVLVVNALRFAAHPSHFNLEEALALIRRVGPRGVHITHMSHEIGLHAKPGRCSRRGIWLTTHWKSK